MQLGHWHCCVSVFLVLTWGFSLTPTGELNRLITFFITFYSLEGFRGGGGSSNWTVWWFVLLEFNHSRRWTFSLCDCNMENPRSTCSTAEVSSNLLSCPHPTVSAPHPPHSLLPGAAAAAASGGCLSWTFCCWPAPSLTPSAWPPAASWRRSTRPGTSCSARCASPSSRTSAASTLERGGCLETTVEKKRTASSPPRTAAGSPLTSKWRLTLRSGWRWPRPSSLWSAADCCAHSTRPGCSGLTCLTLVTGSTGELSFIISLLHSH